jgi:3-phytase
MDHRLIRSFGDTSGEGVLHKVESISLDELYNRVLVAEEEEKTMCIKIYTLTGEFTGNVMGKGLFKAEPEGIGLYEDGDEGFWIAVDQHKKKTVFQIYSRKKLEFLGSFSGKLTANTDGICVTNKKFHLFPVGAVFAIHDDSTVTGFSWEEIEKLYWMAR